MKETEAFTWDLLKFIQKHTCKNPIKLLYGLKEAEKAINEVIYSSSSISNYNLIFVRMMQDNMRHLWPRKEEEQNDG
jgi:hypothetical protein